MMTKKRYLLGFSATKMPTLLFTEGHGAYVPFDPVPAVEALLLSLLVGLAAGSYPAFTASRLDPNEALRAL